MSRSRNACSYGVVFVLRIYGDSTEQSVAYGIKRTENHGVMDIVEYGHINVIQVVSRYITSMLYHTCVYIYIYGQTPCYARHVPSVLRCRVGFVWQVCDFGHLRCYAVLRTCCRRVSKLADDLCVGVCFCRKYARCLLSHTWWARGFLQCHRGKVSFCKVIHLMIKVNSSEGCHEAWLSMTGVRLMLMR